MIKCSFETMLFGIVVTPKYGTQNGKNCRITGRRHRPDSGPLRTRESTVMRFNNNAPSSMSDSNPCAPYTVFRSHRTSNNTALVQRSHIVTQ